MKHPLELQLLSKPARVPHGPSGFKAVFPPEGLDVAQVLTFPRWNAMPGDCCREVVDAFIAIYPKAAPSTRSIAAGFLNKLQLYIRSREYHSLLMITPVDVEMLQSHVGRTISTRAHVWTVIYRVLRHTFSAAGLRAPQMESHPWSPRRGPFHQAQPCEPAHLPDKSAATPFALSRNRGGASGPKRRSLLAGQSATPIHSAAPLGTHTPHLQDTLGHFRLYIPARGRYDSAHFDFSDWRTFNSHLAKEIVDYGLLQICHLSLPTIKLWRSRCKTLLDYLRAVPTAHVLQSFSQVTASIMNGYRDFIDRGTVPRRAKWWRNARAIVIFFCQRNNVAIPPHQRNPWPGHGARGPVATRPMTTVATSELLAACATELNRLETSCRDPNYCGPTLQELYAPLVLLTFWTMFNPETVVAIKCTDITPSSPDRIGVTGVKGRSSREQYATFAAVDHHPCSPSSVISLLHRLTAPIRERVEPTLHDYLFIGRVLSSKAKAHLQTFDRISSSTMLYYRNAFCEQHSLQHFTLQQIRETGAVAAMRLLGGNQKAVQALLNHESIDTTSTYIQRDTRRLENVALADQMEKRARYVRSRGKRDLRDTAGGTESAATPGFVCADPFNPPPELDQPHGMCAAYGACPTCPLASVDIRCATSLAQVLRLRNQIAAARDDSRMEPVRWVEIWRPRLLALEDHWLVLFDVETVRSAAAAIWDIRVPEIVDL